MEVNVSSDKSHLESMFPQNDVMYICICVNSLKKDWKNANPLTFRFNFER
uniref:Macaca fascicularis brain cDNA clone: QflA-17053, similar to human ret finger protein-like 3 antisense (RFPL3S) onchromosome 22, RefSeq: NR_001450.1 n=1 Tax=Macaca fascicularis TaxID=9541 RepID=I7GI46_MACFA|nr:unnamed protein product [Macaca fascicularis]